jgi:choline dehydrogenase-like flavoprotein
LKKHSGISYKARISWAGDKRKSDQLLAVSGTLLFMRARSQFATEDSGFPKGGPKDWWNAVRLLTKGYIFSPIHNNYLAVSAEDLRDPNSRIILSPTAVDAYGNPLAVIDWRVSSKVCDSIIHFTDEFERLLQTCDLGILKRFYFANDSLSLHKHLKDNSHHIGATSMGNNQSIAVVDNHLKVFGFNNLYVAGTSVLPTGSHANPTLTALAMSLRLAEHLAKRQHYG